MVIRLRSIESVVLFVPDIDAAAQWYAELFGTTVEHENPQYAFVRGGGTIIGFHPADASVRAVSAAAWCIGP